MSSTIELCNWKKKIQISKNLILILLLTHSLFSQDLNTDLESNSEKKKSPLENEEEDSTFKKINKKHGFTPEQVKKKKEIIEKILKYGSNKERKEAMRELSSLPSEGLEELTKLVSEILSTDTDTGIKISSLRTLGFLEAKSESTAIINSLKDKSDDVKEVAIQTIQKIKLEEASTELNSLLKNLDFNKPNTLTPTAINCLADIDKNKLATDYLENKIKDKTTIPEARSSIALYFGKLKETKVESSLLEIALDEAEDVSLRSFCINALGKMNSPRAATELRNTLKKINEAKSKTEIKKNSILKLYIISALIQLGDKEILKDLVVYAKDDDASVRLRAIKQLGEIPDISILELMEYKAQRDPSKKVQEVAKKILEEWKQKGIVNTSVVKNNTSEKPIEKNKERDDEWMINKGKMTPKVFPR
jgi:HEAT repeat protein